MLTWASVPASENPRTPRKPRGCARPMEFGCIVQSECAGRAGKAAVGVVYEELGHPWSTGGGLCPYLQELRSPWNTMERGSLQNSQGNTV